MKKYLMIGLAALAFASCAKHDFETMTQEQIVKAEYDAKFVAHFQQPASNHTWGFGATTRAAAPAFTRAVPGITFPTFSDSKCPSMPTKYKNTLTDAIKDGAIYAKTYAEEHPHDKYPKGATIYIDEAYPQFHGENQVGNVDNLIIYVDGIITLDEAFSQNDEGTTLCVTENSTLKLKNVRENLTIYLAPKATLDLSESTCYVTDPVTYVTSQVNGAVFTKSTAALYMSSGSTVSGGTLYFKDGYTVLNEAGTIDVDELHVENGAILFNKNKIDVEGVIALRNTNGELVNFDEIDAASMTLDAGAMFYNVSGGQVDITGLTKLNNDGGTNKWQNSGKFNTQTFEITGGCGEPAAFNNCHMSVTNQFYMNHGYFVLDGGAAVECGSFRWDDDNYFDMGSKALLSISGQLIANNNDTGYGFYGKGSEYAVIQAGSVVKESEGKFRAAYFGNLFIDTNNHFPQGRSSADGTWYTWGEGVKFSFTDENDEGATKATDFSITIEKDNDGGCTPGYSYDPDPVVYEGRIMAEDLTVADNSDWDFNDVVFDWTIKNKKAYIKLLAAGGTLPIRVGGYRSDNSSQPTGSIEIHGADALGGYMVNTGVNTGKTSAEFVLTDHEYADHDGNDILVTVYKGGEWIEITAEQGEPAGKFNAPINTLWCEEYANIKKVYSSFASWVKNSEVEWAVNPTAKYVDYEDVNDNKKEAAAVAE